MGYGNSLECIDPSINVLHKRSNITKTKTLKLFDLVHLGITKTKTLKLFDLVQLGITKTKTKLFDLVQLGLFFLLFQTQFAEDCLKKQIFVHNSSQSQL